MDGDVGMKDYILHFIAQKDFTLSEYAQALGYKSVTSLKRLMEGDVKTRAYHQFEERMVGKFTLSADEKVVLHREILSVLNKKCEDDIHNGIFKWLTACSDGSMIACDCQNIQLFHGVSGTNNKEDLYHHLLRKKDIRFLIINNTNDILFSSLRSLLKEMDISIEHYLLLNKDLTRTVNAISTLMPIFFFPRYQVSYLISNDSDSPVYLTNNLLFIEFTNEEGAIEAEELFIDSDGRTNILESNTSHVQMIRQIISSKPWKPLKKSYFCNQSEENYIQYSAQYAALEHDRSIYKVKPDIGIDYIPMEILRDATAEGPMEKTTEFNAMVTALMKIYSDRTQNTFAKRKTSHTVLKKNAMISFAKTGVQTDHFWGMRPYTKSERLTVFQLLKYQMINNVFFNLHFLADDDLIQDIEIACYSQRGFLILDAASSYDLTAGHSEIMLSCQPLEDAFIEFFREVLIPKYCLSYQESISFIEKLIDICTSE